MWPLISCLLLVLVTLNCQVLTRAATTDSGDKDEVSNQHSVEKRSQKTNPRFEDVDYQVMEGNTTLEGLVCIIAGGDERFLSVFSARGVRESCPRFPCPQATEGEDFVAVGIREFFLKPGSKVCVDITVMDDDIIEGREFFLLALKDLRWGEIIATIVVTIEDDDDPSLLRTSQIVLEDVGVASVCVLGGKQTVLVKMEVLNISTASAPSSESPGSADFQVLDEGAELTVEPGGMACFRISIIDDDLDENPEDILVRFTQGNDTNAIFSFGGTITIADNDFSPTFERTFYDVQEGDGSVQVCVVFYGAGGTVSARISTQDGSAVGFSDYMKYESEFNISGGERRCHDIQLVDDLAPEKTERFDVSITSSNSVTKPSRAYIRVQDDDVLDFDGSVRRYFTVEANTVPICVSLIDGRSNTSIMGFIYTRPRSAKGNEDFVSIQESFLFNHMQRMCFSLAVLQDSIPELDEELTIYLLTISSGFIVHRVFATLTIRDDDAINCMDLNPPANGQITFLSDGSRPGSVALYACDPTFVLMGSVRRECQLDGVWTGSEPTCELSDAGGLDRNI